MSRTIIPVDKNKLTAILADLENQQAFPNRSALLAKVAEVYNDPKVTVSIVYLRFKEWGITPKTPKGRRGIATGNKIGKSNNIVSGGRSIKFAGNDKIRQALIQLNSIVPEKYKPIVKRVVKGSMSAAVKLKCLDCCNYQTIEVKLCECRECSLWAFRPYQGRL